MRINVKQKIVFPLLLVSSVIFAQEADDGFVVPLNEDFSKAVVAENAGIGNVATNGTTTQPATGPFKELKMGLWLETQSVNESLIRNVSDHTKKGYEFDNSHWKTEANWWFWGKVSQNVFLNSEISVLNFDKTLYKANTYAKNVPDVTWGDGFQSVLEMFASPFKNGNDKGLGFFKKMGLEVTTPYVITRFGYGDLKRNGGMTLFDGIYNVIDYKDWNGYTEIKNGPKIKKFGDFKIDATLAFSDKLESYGTYDILDVKYSDKAEFAFTFGSSSSEEQLFFYNRTNKNAFSTYLAVNPLEKLKLEAHVLGTFGTEDGMKLGSDTMAYAGRGAWNSETWNVSLMQSFAGLKVDSVWGGDGKVYDDIRANTATTQLYAKKAFSDLKTPLALHADEEFTYVLKDDSDRKDYKGTIYLRSEPAVDIDLSGIMGKKFTVGAYGVVNVEKLSENQAENKPTITYLDEAGIEIFVADLIPYFKNAKFDYAVRNDYGEWESGSSYPLEKTYHSIMLTGDVNDKLSATFGSVIRNDKTDSKDTTVPGAFAFGISIKKVPLPGKPRFWTQFTYSMFPYTDNNYTLRRFDEEYTLYAHRTYLLNDLDASEGKYMYTSRVSLGLIWDL